jgi:hypothetical protein
MTPRGTAERDDARRGVTTMMMSTRRRHHVRRHQVLDYVAQKAEMYDLSDDLMSSSRTVTVTRSC